ncbi:hypothetical protein CLU79DRAFT_731094 [Phycomyces nitens]|nr:hypothetical protein CLU79DRAFT_731094 [Phycomyces nitens]
MPNSNEPVGLCDLPLELILKISKHLYFSDVWYLGTCSKKYRQLAFQILIQDYDINLIKPYIINPLDTLIHSAVAFIGRHGYDHIAGVTDKLVLQSASNRLAKEIYYRSSDYLEDYGSSFEFILDKSFTTLFSHIFFNRPIKNLRKDGPLAMNLKKFYLKDKDKDEEDKDDVEDEDEDEDDEEDDDDDDDDEEDDENEEDDDDENDYEDDDENEQGEENRTVEELIQSIRDLYKVTTEKRVEDQSNVLIADFITLICTKLTSLFSPHSIKHIWRKLLVSHLDRSLASISKRYKQAHKDRTIFSKTDESCPKYHVFLYFEFICALFKNNLISPADVDSIIYHQLKVFFVTNPTDIVFTSCNGLYINPNTTNGIYNPDDQKSIFYIWIIETGHRMDILMDIICSARIYYSNPRVNDEIGFPMLFQLFKDSTQAFKSE